MLGWAGLGWTGPGLEWFTVGEFTAPSAPCPSLGFLKALIYEASKGSEDPVGNPPAIFQTQQSSSSSLPVTVSGEVWQEGLGSAKQLSVVLCHSAWCGMRLRVGVCITCLASRQSASLTGKLLRGVRQLWGIF
jgi:hypothetical protein